MYKASGAFRLWIQPPPRLRDMRHEDLFQAPIQRHLLRRHCLHSWRLLVCPTVIITARTFIRASADASMGRTVFETGPSCMGTGELQDARHALTPEELALAAPRLLRDHVSGRRAREEDGESDNTGPDRGHR